MKSVLDAIGVDAPRMLLPLFEAALGLGTWQLRKETAVAGVLQAFEAGYRHIDTAMRYENKRAIRRALRRSGLKRDDYFLTTKGYTELAAGP